MERRRFTAEFKREAVNLAGQDGVSRAKVARELGLNVNMLAAANYAVNIDALGSSKEHKQDFATLFRKAGAVSG